MAAKAMVSRALDSLVKNPNLGSPQNTDNGDVDPDMEYDALTWKSIVVGSITLILKAWQLPVEILRCSHANRSTCVVK